jgi:hypothetical protein
VKKPGFWPPVCGTKLVSPASGEMEVADDGLLDESEIPFPFN